MQDQVESQASLTEAVAATDASAFGWDNIWDKVIEYGTNLAIAVAVLVIGLIIAKRLSNLVGKVLKRKELDDSLQGFLVSMVSITLKILVVLTALSQLGVEMTSFVALIGAAGLAIGMAFSGTLGNFAGGIMILIFRPYKVGDYISTQDEEGTVHEIQIFNTILMTLEGNKVIIPNGVVANNKMTNLTHREIRRVDFTVGIAYGDDYDTAKSVLSRFVAEDENILQDADNFIGLVALADSSVNLTVRVWTKVENYWDVYFKMNEKIYKEFGKEGLNIPFPQMDVHVHNN